MKSFDGHTEYVNGVLIFSSCESNLYDFLKDAVYSGGTGCDRSNILPPGAHFLFYRDLSFLKRRLLI
jgi:hypothetical protein